MNITWFLFPGTTEVSSVMRYSIKTIMMMAKSMTMIVMMMTMVTMLIDNDDEDGNIGGG